MSNKKSIIIDVSYNQVKMTACFIFQNKWDFLSTNNDFKVKEKFYSNVQKS